MQIFDISCFLEAVLHVAPFDGGEPMIDQAKSTTLCTLLRSRVYKLLNRAMMQPSQYAFHRTLLEVR